MMDVDDDDHGIVGMVVEGPLAPVIRGNPWGLDRGIVNHDWAYVMFDWDNHFGVKFFALVLKALLSFSIFSLFFRCFNSNF